VLPSGYGSANTLVSKPAGPLQQCMLSLGGCFFLWARFPVGGLA
jgi:hypothetical protein